MPTIARCTTSPVRPALTKSQIERLLEKLRRNGGHGLKSIQDLAGMRIVARTDRRDQDAIVEQLIDVFGEDPRPPKVVDRRAVPVNGYRAVHVIGIPVEVQVRTRLQHEWAELFEKLADRVGRGIAYGDPT